MDALLRQSLEALGLPALEPEPEVIASTLARIRCRSLAGIIVALLTDNEPLLRADQDGSTVTVREIGGSSVMQFTIREQMQSRKDQ